jgi:glycosyltransferase involved in cell wall biosynthesis
MAATTPLRTLAVLHLAEAGGPAQHVRPWLAALAERGSLHVVVPGEGSARELYTSLGETSVLTYEPLLLPRGPVALARFAWRFGHDTWSFYRHLGRARYDLVVVVTSVLPAALFAARLRRIPAVVYVAEIFDKGHVRGRFRTITRAAVGRYTERLAQGLVCCSATVARQFREGSRRTVVATAYPGVRSDWGSGQRDRFRERHGLARADPCLAVLGNLTPGRGQDVAIRAVPVLQAAFPHVSCIVAGVALRRPADLAYERSLRSLVAELDLTQAVAFVGFVDIVEDVYAAADIVINPALFNEPLGRVALETLAAGRPVVASRVGAIPEVLRDGVDGLLVEPHDPAAIAAAVSALWPDAGLRTRLVNSGRARVRALFDERAGVEAFLRVVDEVLVRNGRRRRTA